MLLWPMRGRELIAWNLRRLRVAAGISQERLAADAGIDRAYLGGLENRRGNPTIDVLDRIADHLEIRVGELLVEPAAGDPSPPPLKRGRRKA